MLNVTAQRSAEGAKKYFSKSDYYSEGQELVGNWGGKSAVLLGLFGEVAQKAFDNLCDNIHPQTGRQLTRITRDDRRVLYDFTWSAPKSISVVHALTGDERIVSAFRDSVSETMQEMEEEMQTRVRRGNADANRTTGNMVWAEFVHKTSRPVNGLPCPQLHIHAAAMNVTYDPAEEKWKAGQFGRIKGDAYFWQAVQQARFTSKLQTLGYGIRKTKDAFEIAGVPDAVMKKFSLRTIQIEKVAEKLGITDPKAKAKLAATTREAKLDSIPYPDLVDRWNTLLTPAEREAVSTTAGKSRAATDRSDEHVAFAADHSFERASVVDERRLMTVALRHGIGSVTPEGVRKGLKQLGLLKREENGKVMVTTEAILKEEQKLLAFAVTGKGSCQPIASALHDGWESEIPTEKFSDEQRHAVEQLLRSTDRVMIVRGRAGTGKTTLTTAAVDKMEEAGRRVVMLAPSANASRNVLRSEGFAQADTLARFLVDKEMQASAQHGVIWLDEAGLVGSRTLLQLFDTARSLDARVVLSGDKRQMASVERGSPLRLLEDVAGLKVAELTEIYRQSGDYRDAVKLLAAGKAGEGLDKLDRLGWLKTLPVWDRYAPVARDFVQKLISTRGDPNGVLIVSPTHSEGEKIIAAVRSEMREHGLIHGEERTFHRLVPLQWTKAQRGDREEYAGDEVLQFHRNSGSFKAGARVKASDMLASRQPPRSANFATYGDGTIALAAGDLIRITANGKTQDEKHKVYNGNVYVVAGFTPAGDITLSNGWVLNKDFAHIAQGYSTAHASQGRTVQHVIICQSAESQPATSREGFYVAVSRGKKSATIYTDSKAELKATAVRSNPRLTATELVAKPRVEWWHRTRDRITRMRLNALIAEKAHVSAEEPKKEYAHGR